MSYPVASRLTALKRRIRTVAKALGMRVQVTPALNDEAYSSFHLDTPRGPNSVWVTASGRDTVTVRITTDTATARRLIEAYDSIISE